MKAEHNCLYVATNDVSAYCGRFDRKIVVEKGEIVEFRYFSPVNFRTSDGFYCEMSKEDFSKSFKIYGKILSEVSSQNKLSLYEILILELYSPEKYPRIICKVPRKPAKTFFDIQLEKLTNKERLIK